MYTVAALCFMFCSTEVEAEEQSLGCLPEAEGVQHMSGRAASTVGVDVFQNTTLGFKTTSQMPCCAIHHTCHNDTKLLILVNNRGSEALYNVDGRILI